MLEEKIADAIVAGNKPEETLDGVIEMLANAQYLLDPTKTDLDLTYAAGVAVQEIAQANKILRAFRRKQYGQKPISVL